MTLIRVAIAAAVLIFPGAALAASDETPTALERSAATEHVLSTAEANGVVTQDTVREAGRESQALARAPAAPPAARTRAKAVRPSKHSAVRAAPAPQHHLGCFGYWCGRQFVLMIGIGY
jgi:hypothetical protein